ncbi:OsmC family protein [candidate division TA06 bacterium]|uniref:OsmC family protein n=1 Tax=candidate division TA06 bacterium TaxID=2250710 RepID=A0A933MLB5_UNCT6|nr:OsmC family protein [candidate division TA06 bacterium]
MPLTLQWVKDLQFVAEDEKGHGLVVESRKDGIPAGFAPMQLVLLAAAGCMAMDMVSILQKKKMDIKGFRVLMDGKRAEEHPKRFTEMNFVYEVKGDIPKEAVDEAIRLSQEKYCSVSATIRQGAVMNIESKVVAG